MKKYIIIIFICLFVFSCNTEDQRSDMFMAIVLGDLDEVKSLSKFVNVNEPYNEGNTFLEHAIVSKEEDIAIYLIDKMKNINSDSCLRSMNISILYDYSNIVEKLIEKGLSVNEKDYNGVTHIVASIAEGNTKTFKVLLDNDADLSITDNKGITGLEYLMSIGNKEMITYWKLNNK